MEEHWCDNSANIDKTKVMPCSLGETVFVIPTAENGIKEITPMKCNGFMISVSGNTVNLLNDKNKLYQPSFEMFGKSCFTELWRAEISVKKGENNVC